MRSLVDMDTIQIEITNACPRLFKCSNCTRMGQHMEKPFFMEFDQFKEAVDSMVGYPRMVGMMGGEPLIHPQFEKFCEYMLSKIPRERLGLWTALPDGREEYASIICETFNYVFLNDHTRGDIYHHPFLVGINEIVPKKEEIFVHINRCEFQHSWSASINPNGAFFCEIAASLAMLYNRKGWPVYPGWWWKTPKDFTSQIEEFCPVCGGSVPLNRRCSVERIDDISPWHYEQLKDRSPKIKKGLYAVHDLKITQCPQQMAAYKDLDYRDKIAARYGMYLTITPDGFWEPHMGIKPPSLFSKLQEWYGD